MSLLLLPLHLEARVVAQCLESGNDREINGVPSLFQTRFLETHLRSKSCIS